MGIKDLYSFLQNRSVPFEQHRPSFYSNSTIAVDAYSLFFRLFYMGKKISLENHQTSSVALLQAFVSKWPKTTTLVFIFDCPVKSELKMETLQKRREAEQNIQKEIKEIEESSKSSPFNPLLLARKDALQRRSKETFPLVCKEMRNLLATKGHRIVIADDEAEHLACEMAIRGEANYVYSNDSDCLALACPAVIFDENGGTMKMYRHSTILRTIGMNKEQFRDFCILLGTDYNARIMPPVEAYTAITESGSLENIPSLDEKIIKSLEKIRQQYTIQTVAEEETPTIQE